jgi:hypothetical protein
VGIGNHFVVIELGLRTLLGGNWVFIYLVETGVFLNHAWFRFGCHCDYLCFDCGFVELRVKQEGFENDEN